MKKFFNSILLLCFLWCPDVGATLVDIQDSKNDNVIQLELNETPEKPKLTGEENFEEFLKTAKYFDEKYPGNKIYEDLTEDIAQKFPQLSSQEVYDYQDYIRTGLMAYRKGKELYEDYLEAKLTPEEAPLILPDEEFDLSSPQSEYIDSGDKTLIIEDFKKVISYSKNPREIKAYRAKIERDLEKKGKLNDFEELGFIFSKIDFQKFFFYNILYENPITGKHGIGNWIKQDNLKIRLITEASRIPEDGKINGLIHLLLPDGISISALNGKGGHKPEISFASSENLKDIQIHLPVPNRFKKEQIDFPLYSGTISFPFTAEVKDKNTPLTLKADVILDVCSIDKKCQSKKFMPELKLYTGKNRDSSVAVFVRMMQNFIIPQLNTQIKVEDFYLEQLTSGQNVLTLKMRYPEKIESFNIFAGNNKEQSFERPRVQIDNNLVTARFILLDEKISLENEAIEVLGLVNQEDAFHFNLIAHLQKSNSTSDIQLTWALFFAALLGGFLLNFMPCVFPVLSLKVLSLTKFGARNISTIKKSFDLTLLGIWCSFALIIAILIILKILGQNLGWGMQFQNPWFISIIFFMVLLFVAQIWGIVDLKLPSVFSSVQNNSLVHFLTGTLTVLMATPCTAPYLGTAIGFALAGEPLDIVVILSGVALGLSIPYLFIRICPQTVYILPAPGQWMNKVNHFMAFMLVLTLIWLLHIVQAQSGTGYCIRLALYSLLFWGVLWLKNLNMQMNYELLTEQEKKKAKRYLNIFFFGLSLLVFTVATVDGSYSARKHFITENAHSNISLSKVNHLVKEGKTVLVIIDADWCLTCRYNDIMVFKNPSLRQKIKSLGVEVIEVDWTNKNVHILELMKKYNRSGLPFYILFSPFVPDGMILPELLKETDLKKLLENITILTPKSK